MCMTATDSKTFAGKGWHILLNIVISVISTKLYRVYKMFLKRDALPTKKRRCNHKSKIH